jgi:acyl-CoA thioesterase I
MIKTWALYGMLILLIQGLAGCSGQENAAAPVNAEPATAQAVIPKGDQKLVVAFGDSLYAGYQLGPKEGLAPQLEAALMNAGMNSRVYNAGVSGDTTAAGKARLAFVLDNLDRKPDLVLVGLGGNDMLRGIRPDQTRANLDYIMSELKRRKIPAVITGMLAPPNLGAEYAKEFGVIFPALSAKYDAPLYPFFLDGIITDKSLMLGDTIHPNAKGVARAVSGIMPLVEKALLRVE